MSVGTLPVSKNHLEIAELVSKILIGALMPHALLIPPNATPVSNTFCEQQMDNHEAELTPINKDRSPANGIVPSMR